MGAALLRAIVHYSNYIFHSSVHSIQNLLWLIINRQHFGKLYKIIEDLLLH